MGRICITGFPGFLGSALLPRVLAPSNDDSAICLVQARYRDRAVGRLADIVEAHPAMQGRVQIVEGDISEAGGLRGLTSASPQVTQIFHLAAIYDLSVPRDRALRINVDGTRRMLDFGAKCRNLRRFHHVSTCFVSGRYAGTFTEDDLRVGQTFNNCYEESKYLSEIAVQERMESGLPATIYRPAIVVGDSKTGATQKYDGPYYVLRWLMRQPRVAVLPVAGNPSAFRVNVVPRDFVVDAISHLSGLAGSEGMVYQLADPEPLTVDAMIDTLARAAGRRVVRVRLPTRVAKSAIDHVPGVYRLMQIPSAAIDYFVHPTSYDSSHTQAALHGTGISVPPFSSYVDKLAAFVQRHPEIGAAAMA